MEYKEYLKVKNSICRKAIEMYHQGKSAPEVENYIFNACGQNEYRFKELDQAVEIYMEFYDDDKE